MGSAEDDYRRVRLQRPWRGREVVPGQFIRVHVADQFDYFAVTNFRGSDTHFDLLVSGGRLSAQSLRQSQVSEQFEVTGPEGRGYPEPLADGYLLVAGGSGVASLLPVVEWSVTHGVPCRLLYLDRGPRMLGSGQLSAVTSPSVSITIWDTASQGRPGYVLSLVGEAELTRAWVCACGPRGLLTNITCALLSRGLGPGDLHLNS